MHPIRHLNQIYDHPMKMMRMMSQKSKGKVPPWTAPPPPCSVGGAGGAIAMQEVSKSNRMNLIPASYPPPYWRVKGGEGDFNLTRRSRHRSCL